MQRMANDSEYQGTLLWMLSDASSYLNGAIIPVEGGRTSWYLSVSTAYFNQIYFIYFLQQSCYIGCTFFQQTL